MVHVDERKQSYTKFSFSFNFIKNQCSMLSFLFQLFYSETKPHPSSPVSVSSTRLLIHLPQQYLQSDGHSLAHSLLHGEALEVVHEHLDVGWGRWQVECQC